MKSKGSPKGKQARDLVYASGFSLLGFLTRDNFSRTIAEAWIVLQVAYRHNLGVNVDYKAAQREGEQSATYDIPYSERVV